MKATFTLLTLGSLFSLTVSLGQPKLPNILLLCVDDLRPELACYGKDYIHSPHIDQLAEKGSLFRKHYVNAPSCGPSRYTLLTGRYGPVSNNALFQRAEQYNKNPHQIPPTMSEWFRQHGYTTVSVGKVSHHPGGWGGADWGDVDQVEIPNAWNEQLMPVGTWKHPRGAMHGLANGEIRTVAGEMEVYQSVAGPDTLYPDGLIVSEGLNQLKQLASDKKPFMLAIGLIKPHLPFGAPKKYLDLYQDTKLPPIHHPDQPQHKTTWHKSGEFMKYNRWGRDPREDEAFAQDVRVYYAAFVSYTDHHVGLILNELKKLNIDETTIVVLWGDHGWHLGEHAIWGKHSLFEEALHAPLMIAYPGNKKSGKPIDEIVETLDVFPTLCELAGIAIPDFTQGKSLLPLLEKQDKSKHAAIAYKGKAKTIRTEQYRLILHQDGFVELYDHESNEKETKNIAQNKPDVVKKLKELMAVKLQKR
ncbi:MAG: sulfatase [Bacteroidota bacterium]